MCAPPGRSAHAPRTTALSSTSSPCNAAWGRTCLTTRPASTSILRTIFTRIPTSRAGWELSNQELPRPRQNEQEGGPPVVIHVGTIMLAACSEDQTAACSGVAVSTVSRSTSSNDGAGTGANQPDPDGCILRCARCEDVGIKDSWTVCLFPMVPWILSADRSSRGDHHGHRRLRPHEPCAWVDVCKGSTRGSGCYNLSTWAPIKSNVLFRRLCAPSTEPVSITVRITTVALRETRVGDKFASHPGRGCLHHQGVGLPRTEGNGGWNPDGPI